MDIEILRVKLENFVGRYVPKGWREAISDADFVPLFTDEELKVVSQGRVPDGCKLYVAEAIREFIQNGRLEEDEKRNI